MLISEAVLELGSACVLHKMITKFLDEEIQLIG
jgi:hypothetical protein